MLCTCGFIYFLLIFSKDQEIFRYYFCLICLKKNCCLNVRYKQHKTDYETLPQTRPIPVPCRASGCKCKSYHYVPKNGTQPVRCQCKHFTDDHSEVVPYKCSNGCSCKAFRSSYTCGCGEPTYAHKVGAVRHSSSPFICIVHVLCFAVC